jgi:hypothetical protein
MVPFCVLQFDLYQLRPAIYCNTTYNQYKVTIIWMIIAVTRFFTMSSVASSYLDTRYSGEREEHLYQTMGYQTMEGRTNKL